MPTKKGEVKDLEQVERMKNGVQKNLPTIDIKGKEYVMVKDRVLAFNEAFPGGAIRTEIVADDGKTVTFKATVCPDEQSAGLRARNFTGHSEAVRGGSGVNATAALENAETSAVGRALAMMGIGVLESVASADEVRKAIGSGGPVITETQPYSAPAQSQATVVAPTNDDKENPPASFAQKEFIKRLCGQKGKPVPTDEWFATLRSKPASQAIDALLKSAATTTNTKPVAAAGIELG